MRIHLTAIAYVAIAVLQTTFQQPARDSRAVLLTGTAAIAGQLLTDEATAQPVRRARVTLTATDGRPIQTVFSDDAGRFEAGSLPAGRYLVSATRPGFVRAAYGAKRYDRQGTPVTLADGQRIADLLLKLPRGSVITGVVRDEFGQPAPGVPVRALEYRTQSGERTLLPAGLGGGPINETTDDRGIYRIYGLPAGEYVVAVQPRIAGPGDVRQMTAADVSSAQRALRQSAAAGTTRSAPEPAPPPTTVTYAPVYYPSAMTAATAVTIQLGTGEERGGVDLALQLVRTARIEGMVTTPQGVPPQSVQLLMVPAVQSGAAPALLALNRASPDAEGKFSYSGIAPGQYTINARTGGGVPGGPGGGGRGGGGGAGAAAAGPQLWASADVSVDGTNITGVSLNLQPGMTVSGRVVVEAVGADTPEDLSRTRLSLTPAPSPGGTIMIGSPGAQVDRTGRFTFTGVTPGKYHLTGGLNSPEAEWNQKSASAKGRDALDLYFEVLPNENVSDAVMTFTNQTQDVSGSLQDASGRPAPDFTIVLFPADRTLWSAPRRIRTTRPGTDGRFQIKGLPAGSYRIAAVIDIEPGDSNDPTFLDQLVAASVAFTLKDGESKVQDLRIK